MKQPSAPNWKKVKETTFDSEKIFKDVNPEENLIVSEFNMAGWDLETVAVFYRHAQTMHAESLKDPSLLVYSIESLRHAVVNVLGIIPKTTFEKFDKKLGKLQEDIDKYFFVMKDADFEDIYYDERFRKLREEVRKYIQYFAELKNKYGLGIPVRITMNIQDKIKEAVDEL